MYKAAELELFMRDETVLCIGGDDEKWYARAETELIEMRWRYVIIPSAGVIPRHENSGVTPIIRAADFVDDRRDP